MRVHPGSSSPNGVGVAINGSEVANVAAATTTNGVNDNNGTNGGDCNGSSTRTAMVAEAAVECATAEAELYRKKVRMNRIDRRRPKNHSI